MLGDMIEPRRATTFIGNAADEALLKQSGLLYGKATVLPAGETLAILSADAAVTPETLANFARSGGRAMVMAARQEGKTAQGVTLRKNDKFTGSLDVPEWPVCRGLSASDLRWLTTGSAYLLSDGCDTAKAPQHSVRRAGRKAGWTVEGDEWRGQSPGPLRHPPRANARA